MKLDRYLKNSHLLSIVSNHTFTPKQEKCIHKILEYLDFGIKNSVEDKCLSIFLSLLKIYVLQSIFVKKFLLITRNTQNIFVEDEIISMPMIENINEFNELCSKITSKSNIIKHKILVCKAFLPSELIKYI